MQHRLPHFPALLLLAAALAGPVHAQIPASASPAVPAPQSIVPAVLPANLRPLAEAAGLTADESNTLASALKAFEQGRGEVEARVAAARKVWTELNAAVPVDDAALAKVVDESKAAGQARRDFYEQNAVTISSFMSAEKYAIWVASDLQRMVVRELERNSVKLEGSQSPALAELCNAEALRLIGEKIEGTKAARIAVMAKVRASLLNAGQLASIEADEAARLAAAAAKETPQSSSAPITPPAASPQP